MKKSKFPLSNVEPFPMMLFGKVPNSANGWLFNQITGDLAILSSNEYRKFLDNPSNLSSEEQDLLMKRNFLYKKGKAPHIKIPRTNILTLWIQTTNACNLRCPFCFVYKKQPNPIDVQKTTKQLEKFMQYAKDNGYSKLKLKYAGGEPTLPSEYPKIIALHRELMKLKNKYNIEIEEVIITNGTFLDQEKVKELKKLDIHVAVSVDGWGAVHDKSRPMPSGGSTFERVLRTIKLLYKNENSFNLSVVLHKDNVKQLSKLIAFTLDRPRPIPMVINFVRDNQYSVNTMKPSNKIIIKYLKQYMDQATEYIRKYNHSPIILNSFLDYIDITSPRNFVCQAGKAYWTLNASGDISTCHMLLDERWTNINNQTLEQDLQKPNAPPKRLTVDEKADCKTCPIRYICGGGCPILTKETYATYDHSSPYCSVYQEMTYYMLGKIAEIYMLEEDK